jgi:anthranilate/para-aminobenzoate synthase component II
VVRHDPVHGKTTTIEHDGRSVFAGLRSPLTVGRYHSLVVLPDLPDCLEVSATGAGVVMGIRHRELPAEGVQFHPESVLTDEGMALLRTFLGPIVARPAPEPGPQEPQPGSQPVPLA